MSSNAHYNRARHRAWAAKVLRRAGYLCEVCRRYGRLAVSYTHLTLPTT